MKLVGSNFPLVRPTAVLSGPFAQQPISRKPTHVVIRPVGVFAEPSADVTMQELPTGSVVTLLRTEQGRALVARDGKELGYVDASALLAMQ
jgi:hypothetical protein